MSESYREKFIYNNEIKECVEFKDEIFNNGKSLYEVIRIIEGVPLFLEDHLKRIFKSAQITGLELWLREEEIKENISMLSKANKVESGNVKIVFNFNKDEKIFLCYFVKHNYPSEAMYEKGVETSLYNAERENPNAKVINLSLREATNKIIKETGVYEVILVNKDGYITEGSRSNIFMIEGKNVYTAPLEDVLPGITRDYIIRACENLGYKVIEKRVSYKDINELHGMFISGTSPKVLPISRIDNIYFDTNNKVLRSIMAGFDNIIKDYINENK